MTGDRSHPFDLMFGGFRAEQFPAIRTALAGSSDVDSFVLAAPALELLRELRPDEGLGDGVDDFVALVHAAYLYWRDGEVTHSLDHEATRALTRPHPARSAGPAGSSPVEHQSSGAERPLAPLGVTGTRYVQVAPHIIWGQLDADAPFEPLDGWFSRMLADGTLYLVSCFGVHEQRPGVSVVVVHGPRPVVAARADGSSAFAPTMPGGDAAGLHAVSAPEELLHLAWCALNETGA